jgi:hypothetical protein
MNDREPAGLEPSTTDLIEGSVRKLVSAIVIAGGLIAIGLYWQPSPPHYQAVAADGRVYRIDTRSGTIIGCQGERCAFVLRHGQDLDDNLPPPPAPRQVAPPAPAPAQAPTPAAQPVPATH